MALPAGGVDSSVEANDSDASDHLNGFVAELLCSQKMVELGLGPRSAEKPLEPARHPLRQNASRSDCAVEALTAVQLQMDGRAGDVYLPSFRHLTVPTRPSILGLGWQTSRRYSGHVQAGRMPMAPLS